MYTADQKTGRLMEAITMSGDNFPNREGGLKMKRKPMDLFYFSIFSSRKTGISQFRFRGKRGERGFTLIELLIVLVILSLLAALVGPTLVERLKPAKRTAARAQIEEFSSALDNFYVDVGRYPTTEEGLAALVDKPESVKVWKGPYLKKSVPNDPWGNAYIYRSPGQKSGYDIISYGADGKEGGEGENADVNSWEEDQTDKK
jgi:general secretion pathway protein G